MSERRALDIPASHPAYAGHFPGQPVLPAVVLLAEALAAIAEDTGIAAHRWRVSQAKFLRAVVPGAPLTLTHERTPGGARFEIASAGQVVASGTLAESP